jgi:dimethylargininase
MLALTREISPAIVRCELTHLPRQPIDLSLARAQHLAYERALEVAGCTVARLPANDSLPDSVFIEDVAVVFDEVAIMTRPGAESRRLEAPAVADVLRRHRPLCAIDDPGTLDGGDVLTVGRRVFVGLSARTNRSSVAQMRRILGPHGYSIEEVEVDVGGCLHLKSAVTAVDDETLLINRCWADAKQFAGLALIDVAQSEPHAANVLRVGGSILCAAACPMTQQKLEAHGARVTPVDVSELAKAEGAVTCCSVIFKE